jgi:hypothetical protein
MYLHFKYDKSFKHKGVRMTVDKCFSLVRALRGSVKGFARNRWPVKWAAARLRKATLEKIAAALKIDFGQLKI